MITVIIPVFSIEIQNILNNDSQLLKQTDSVFEYAIDFYKKYIGIKEIDHEYFLTIGNFNVEINFGLLKKENEIISQLNKADIPLIRFLIDKNMLSFVNKIYNDKINILSLTETLGGYKLLIKDPFNNIIQIECEDFEDDNIENIDTSEWNFYYRM